MALFAERMAWSLCATFFSASASPGGYRVSIAPSETGIGGVVTVDLVFNFTGLFPALRLPGLGEVPPLPRVLIARGVVGV